MRTGPRLFAVAILAAAALLPKTGWIVRNEADLLMGRWSDPSVALGISGPSRLGLAPLWAFEPDEVRDPVAKAVTETMLGHESAEERWARVRPLLRDLKVREADRAAVLRRSFTSVLASPQDPAFTERMRGLVKELRPLAVEGERADPFNAFYPTCRAVLEQVAGDSAARDAAIRRASECTFYDDDAMGEAKRFAEGFEREHGYRGSVLRLTKAATVLLPQHAQFDRVVRDVLAAAPLDAPRRRKILAIGETLVRTGKDKITVFVGRGLMLLAVAEKVDPNAGFDVEVDVARWFAPFERANPAFDTKEAKRLIQAATPEDSMEFAEYEAGVSSLATAVGSGLLLAALMALALAWPTRKSFDDAFVARLSRAHWAWIGLIPAAFADGRAEYATPLTLLTGVAALAWGLTKAEWGRKPAVALVAAATMGAFSLIGIGAPLWAAPGLLWLLAVLVPERGRSFAAGAYVAFVAGFSAWEVVTAHGYGGAYVVLGTLLFLLAARKALPSRGGFGSVAAVAASLWLVGLGAELLADAQTNAALDRLQHQADEFRKARAI